MSKSLFWPVQKSNNNTFVPKQLTTCEFVLLRKSGIIKTLEKPYDGPFKVISRNFENNTFEIDLNGTVKRISMSNLKPFLKYNVSFNI